MVKIMYALALGQVTAQLPSWGAGLSRVPNGKGCKWLPWGAWAECRGVCGSGVQTRVRRCLGGIAGSCCTGNTLDSRGCSNPKDDTCSYWSGWGQWSGASKTCGIAERCKTRTCYGRDTDHCHGPTQLCEPVQNPEPVKRTVCDACSAKCCPHDQPNCGIKQCYTVDDCSPNKIPLSPAQCDQQPPCCDEWTPFGLWSTPAESCFEGIVTRQRHNYCNKNQIDTESKTIDLGEGNWDEWRLEVGCTGKILENNHQCPGQMRFKRGHSCYTQNIHKTDRAGNGLVFDKIEACGSLPPTIISDWDRTEEQCAQICKNRGVFKSRKEIQPCTGEVINEELAVCGIDGGFGAFSEWTECDNTCGGRQWRWQLHSCDIDPQTRRPKVNYEVRNCGGPTPWSEFGPWSNTCADSYPAACADQTKYRKRTNVCGVKDPVSGVVMYEQTETAKCEDPPLPPPVVVVGECSASCIDERTPESFKIQTTTQHCKADEIIRIPCAVPECCKKIMTEVWSECDCTGQQYWDQLDTCPHIAPIRHVRNCVKPLEPYQPFSEWSACSSTCPSLGYQQRYSCPLCEANGPNCSNAKREVRQCPGENPLETVKLGCVASCNQAGTQTVYEIDICTNIKYNERQEPCTIPIAPRPDWLPWGDCAHDRNNVNCPGNRIRKLPAWVDPNTRQVCSPADTQVEACGPADVPANVITEWSTCEAPRCVQNAREYNVCTGLNKVLTQECDLGWSQWGMWSGCNPVTYGLTRQHICTGTQTRVRKHICGRLPQQVETKDCGLEIQLAAEVDLTEATFFDSVYHYYDMPRDALKNPLWSACPATCGPPAVLEGVQMITRRSICPNKWKDITITKTCSIDPDSCIGCGPPQWDAWSECSSKCDIGHQFRSQFRMCKNVATKREWREDLDGSGESRNCGQRREERVSYTACVSANACANGVYCGQGSREKIITAVSVMPTCPADEVSVELARSPEPCPLVACPTWGPFSGETCGICDVSRVLSRVCQKAFGAQSCDCPPGDEITVEQCIPGPSIEWAEWGDYSACSATCGMGTQFRNRAKICDANQIETDTRECFINMGEWRVIENNGIYGPRLVPVSENAGWSACSSTECVAGTQTRQLKHTCPTDLTGAERTETRQCLPLRYPDGGSYEDQQWTQVSGCSQTCGEGLETWSRPHSCKKYNNMADETTYKTCQNPDATPGLWSAWSTCPKCYSDINMIPSRSRSRQWSCAGYGTSHAAANGVEVVSEQCAIPSCAYLSEWSYTPCNCQRRENGFRTRTCINEDKLRGINCGDAPLWESVPCNSDLIVPNLELIPNMDRSGILNILGWQLVKDDWSEWTACTIPCHLSGDCGKQSRIQKTYCVDSTGQYLEPGVAQEERACPCSTGGLTPVVWGECNSPDPLNCPGTQTGIQRHTCGGNDVVDVRPCGSQGSWLEWSDYGACSASCNGGLKQRTRQWSCASAGKAAQTETASCNDNLCNYFGAWSNWAACSVSCGIGTMTRTRYCHGGGEGTGLCRADDNGVMKTDIAKCDMGQCCEWDWSGWTGCCLEKQKNIRLRFRGNQCGQRWEVISKTCEMRPIPDAQQTDFPSCKSLTDRNYLTAQSGVGAKWLNFINPDKVKTEVIQGPTLGHADNPEDISVMPESILQQSPSQFFFNQNQVPFNSAPMVANLTPVVANIPTQIIQAAQAAAPAPIPVAPAPVAPAAPPAPVTPNNSMSWLWGGNFKVNSNSWFSG